MAEKTAAWPESGRVQTIDGLRGLAALLVMLHHLYAAVSRTAVDWLWAPLDVLIRHGPMGIDIFFVISGFVIALTVSKGAPTFSYFGRFILRRSVRLDPPYWAAIALEIALLYLTLRLFSDVPVQLPTGSQVLAHVFYLQELLGYQHVVNIFWTLCYEIQFYAFYVALVVLYAKLPRTLRENHWPALVAAAVFGISLWTRYWPPAGLPNGLAIDRWFQFFIGVLTWRAVVQPGRKLALVGSWIALAAVNVVAGMDAEKYLAIVVSALVLVAAGKPRWERFFALRPIAFLGMISYSLYLYHSSVGWRFVSVVQRLSPGPWSPLQALGVYLVAIGFSIGVATLLWWLIERPCLVLCRRIRLPLRAQASSASVAPVLLESAAP